jgi:DNA-binding transcriptional LysR family regulator
MKTNNLQIDELRAFVAVAERKSFRAAADALFISPPALSRRIERLETALETRLLERTTRRVALTPAGQMFLEHASSVLDSLDAAFQRVTGNAATRKGMVTIATIPSAAERILPEALVEFASRFPDVRIKIVDEGAQEVLAQVIGNAADFGLNFIGAQEPGIDFQPLCRDGYVLVVPRSHALARRRSVAWKDLKAERMIAVSRSSGNRLLIDNVMARMKHRPEAFHEVSHVATLIRLVEAGLGIGVVPSMSLQPAARKDVVGIPLVQPAAHRTLGLISRREQGLSPLAAELYAIVRRHGTRHAA